MEKEGDLRVWHSVNPPSAPSFTNVESIEEAMEVIEQLIQEDLESTTACSNAIGLEVFKGGSWEEFYDKESNDIDDLMSARDDEDDDFIDDIFDDIEEDNDE